MNTLLKDIDMAISLVIDYPAMLPEALQKTKAEFEEEAKMAMAIKLFEMRRLSSGMAADLAGVSRVAFLLNLHRYGTPMIALSEEELKSDLEHA